MHAACAALRVEPAVASALVAPLVHCALFAGGARVLRALAAEPCAAACAVATGPLPEVSVPVRQLSWAACWANCVKG